MPVRPTRLGTRPIAFVATCVVAAGLLVAVVPATAAPAPTPPPNPTPGQISAAQSAKNSLGAEVGRLSGQVAAAQSQLQQLQGQAELAEQKVAFAISKVRLTKQAETRAKARVRAASRTVEIAHTAFLQYVQSSYLTGTPNTSTGSLLTASNPNELLQQSALQRYEARSKVNAIGRMQTATVAKSNADAAARRATKRAKAAKANATRQERLAYAAVTAEAQQKATLQQTLSISSAQLLSAQSRLATLNHEHTQFVAYQAEQRRIRLARAARVRRERLQAERAHQRLLAEQRQQAQERKREREQAASGGGSSNGGSSSSGSSGTHHSHHHSGGSGGGSAPPPSSGGGGWTAAKGREAVHRAMSELGMPYAWAGGGNYGPSYGVCSSADGAPNDCNVRGFDCSGLAMYAWGPYLTMDHYSVNEYSQAGSTHPGIGSLKPGDLLFYSSNGSVSGIHHVAVYKGHGEIIQAPYSGAYVEVSSMYDPGSIFGATRPLT